MTARVTMSLPQALRGECRVDGRLVYLTPQLADVLAALLAAGPRGLTWDEMIEAVWPDPDEQALDAEGVLTVRVHQLRRAGVPVENHPIWGRGYMVPAEARDPSPRMVHGCLRPDACRWRPRLDRKKQKDSVCRSCADTRREERRWRGTVSPLQARVWRFIDRNPGASLVQIGKALGIAPKSAEECRKKLLAKDLLVKVVNPGRVNGRYFAKQGHPRYMAQLREVRDDGNPGKAPRLDPRSVPLMTAIAEDPGATAVELSPRLGNSACSVSTCASRLVKRGAVEKVRTRFEGKAGAQQFVRFLPTESGMRSLNAARQEAGLPPLANRTRGRTTRVHEEIVARARAAADRRSAGAGPRAANDPDDQGPARQGPDRGQHHPECDGPGAHRPDLRQHG